MKDEKQSAVIGGDKQIFSRCPCALKLRSVGLKKVLSPIDVAQLLRTPNLRKDHTRKKEQVYIKIELRCHYWGNKSI